ncbi:2-acylglycerol O-acyltransferase 2-like [Planococcus citri]|uniref:2-acylglycerol O-acyltransferase 2-like n=1 Tax=Planococcus citri TaxID=170843 RepID=UPI0031F91792
MVVATELSKADRQQKSCWRFMGIEFAPFVIPLSRRLETLTVAWFFFSLLLAMFIIFPAFFYLLIFTKYWYLPVLYFSWIFLDRNTPLRGGRKLKWLRNSRIWNYYRDYFPVRLVKTADLAADKNYVFCVYPHGVASVASLLNFQSNATHFDDLYPGIDPYLVVLNVNYRIPFTKDIWLALGAIGAAEESILYCLNGKPGTSCVIMPGGAKEALLSSPGDCKCVLKNRKGFVRVAMKSGAALVPVFSFGENDVFEQLSGPWVLWLQEQLRSIIGIAPCIIKGRGFFQYSFGVLPQRRPVTSVVGAPIHVPKTQNPSQELVDEYHQKYVDALVALFEQYKAKYHVNGDRAKLLIV